jgi:hypothetical protein
MPTVYHFDIPVDDANRELPMVCRNICTRLYTSTQTSGHYSAGAKYCRRCEYYLITTELFCECCGMHLRGSPASREYKEKVRAKKNDLKSDMKVTIL